VRDLYVSKAAFDAIKAGRPAPSGAVFTMEVYRAKLDAAQNPEKDAQGRLIKDGAPAVFVMEKRTGWGGEYAADIRNGEWEYARFLADGKRFENPDMKACFECHKRVEGADFLFSTDRVKTKQ